VKREQSFRGGRCGTYDYIYVGDWGRRA
jgi:hypothetical protein